MKKELFACISIALLLFGAAGSITHLEHTVADITAHTGAASQAAKSGDYLKAEQHISAALQIWQSAENHTQVFLRHAEVDTITDGFYEALSTVSAGDSPLYPLQGLEARLKELLDMEKPSIHSVF